MRPSRTDFSFKNLSVQFNLIVIGIPTLILTGFGFFQLQTQSHALEQNLVGMLKNEAFQLSASLSTALFNFDEETAKSICRAALAKNEIIRITIHDVGDIYLDFVAEGYDPGADSERDVKLVHTDIVFKGETIGSLEVVATTRLMETRLTNLKRSILVQICVLDLVLGFVMALVLLLRFVRPLKALERESEKIAAGELDYPIDTRRRDEIGLLAANLLTMRDAVREKVDSLKSEVQRHEQTSTALKRAKDYIDNILNSLPSVLIAVDPKLAITQWNSKAEEVTGTLRDEAAGRVLTDLLPHLAPMEENILATIRSQTAHIQTRQPKVGDDGVTYEDIAVYPLISKYVAGAVIRIDDVTEHVKMEQMVVQSEKMMSVGGLAAGMAHEINNPLAGMMQNAQVMLRRINEDMPASQEAAEEAGTTLDAIRAFMEKRGISRQLSSIHKAGIQASQIVQNMLSFARQDHTGKTQQDIARILDQTLELAGSDYDLKKRYDFKSVEVVKEYEAGLPQVMCEAGKLQQVFFNIIKNSAQAMQDRDDRTRRLRLVLKVAKAGPDILVEISDNGPGMTEEVRKRVFDPFFTTKSVGDGTGLGLSVAYFIVTDNHGGRMSVASSPGNGASFSIHLPIISP